MQDFIDADKLKGIEDKQSINASSPLFGVQAASVFQIVVKLINSKKRDFKHIGHWFEESQMNWDLIDTHGSSML